MNEMNSLFGNHLLDRSDARSPSPCNSPPQNLVRDQALFSDPMSPTYPWMTSFELAHARRDDHLTVLERATHLQPGNLAIPGSFSLYRIYNHHTDTHGEIKKIAQIGHRPRRSLVSGPSEGIGSPAPVLDTIVDPLVSRTPPDDRLIARTKYYFFPAARVTQKEWYQKKDPRNHPRCIGRWLARARASNPRVGVTGSQKGRQR